MNVTTVEELRNICHLYVKMGKGDKKILISGDDEGNSYHGLYFGFSDPNAVFSGACPPFCQELEFDKTAKLDDYIVLG